MKNVEFSFKKVDDKIFIEKTTIESYCLNDECICWYCPFYSGSRCQGHGEYYGSCGVYNHIDDECDLYDCIVNDNTKCKVYKKLFAQNVNNKKS